MVIFKFIFKWKIILLSKLSWLHINCSIKIKIKTELIFSYQILLLLLMGHNVIPEAQGLFSCHIKVKLFSFLLLILMSFHLDLMPLWCTEDVTCEDIIRFLICDCRLLSCECLCYLKTCVDALTPKMLVLGGGAIEEVLDHKTSAFIRLSCLLLPEDTVRRWKSRKQDGDLL